MKHDGIIAVIPVLNEEETIADVLEKVQLHVDKIVVVDDGSTDNTAKIAKEKGAIIITHTINKGYDKSLDDGFIAADKLGATVIITFDADGEHMAEDIPKLVEPIISGKADLVVGKRPRYQRIAEHIYGLLSKIRMGIDDPVCGLKAYHIKIYKDVGYFDNRSSIGTQLLFEANKKGYKIIQKDISMGKRKDTPRFGKKLEANLKIFKSLVKSI